MPEMRFRIRWPDGVAETFYSPSLVVKDYFAVGQIYALADFLSRSRIAFTIASERVRARYGHACSKALAQLAIIEARGADFIDQPEARVTLDAFEE